MVARTRRIEIGTARIAFLGRRPIERRQHQIDFRRLVLGSEVLVACNGLDVQTRAVGSVTYRLKRPEASAGASPQRGGKVDGLAKACTQGSVHYTAHEQHTDSVCQCASARDTGSQSPPCPNSVFFSKVPMGALPGSASAAVKCQPNAAVIGLICVETD